VAKVRACEFPGYDAWFNSADHLPPHFHLEKPGQWQIRVKFRSDRSEMFEIVWPKNPKKKGGRPKQSELKEIAETVEAHRTALFEQWEQDVNVSAPVPER